jgi:1,4-dihydroxy-2-naphthoate octaprenyltransferase
MAMWRVARPGFLLASAVPVLHGQAMAIAAGYWRPWLFLPTLLGVVSLQAAANMINDHYDYLAGVDSFPPLSKFSGGSGVLPRHEMTPAEVKVCYVLAIGLAVTCGVFVAWYSGWPAIALGLTGVFFSYAYTAPPLKFAYRGLGEAVTGLCFGPLATIGSFFAQASAFRWNVVLASLPSGMLITAVLYLNELRDVEIDERYHKRNLALRITSRRLDLYTGLEAGAYLLTAAMILAGIMPLSSLLLFAAFPLTLRAIMMVRRARGMNLLPPLAAHGATIAAHTLGTLGLAAGYCLQVIFR